jgi:hypothetical protein
MSGQIRYIAIGHGASSLDLTIGKLQACTDGVRHLCRAKSKAHAYRGVRSWHIHDTSYALDFPGSKKLRVFLIHYRAEEQDLAPT